MLKRFSIILIFIAFSNTLFALDDSQLNTAKKIYAIGKQFKTVDGMSIEKTLTAISLRESSLGKYVLGDKKENGEYKPLKEMSLGPFQIRVFTAREIIKNNELKKYYKYLDDTTALINKLITDVEFGARLSAYYFIHNYNEAVARGMSRPYYRAISRHNGGWANKPYFNALMANLKTVRDLEFVQLDDKDRLAKN